MALELNLLGAIYQLLGCQGQVDPYMESTLSLIPETDYLVDRDASGAIKLFQAELATAHKIDNLGGEMLCLTNIGRAQVRLGEFEKAKENLLGVMQITENADWFGIAETHRLLAEVHLAQGQLSKAVSSASQAIHWAQTVQQSSFVGRAWRTLGKIAAQSDSPIDINGQAYDAGACFAKSEQVFKETGIRVERAFTLETWAKYELEHGNVRRGEQMRQKARITLAQLGMKDWSASERQGK